MLMNATTLSHYEVSVICVLFLFGFMERTIDVEYLRRREEETDPMLACIFGSMLIKNVLKNPDKQNELTFNFI